jgi:hypothetical protein
MDPSVLTFYKSPYPKIRLGKKYFTSIPELNTDVIPGKLDMKMFQFLRFI